MSAAWKSYRGAPAPGSSICALADVPEGGTLCLAPGGFPLVLVRAGDGVQGFVNACPHQYLPLDHRGDRLLSSDGAVLRCTNHAAGFSATTGEGVEGLGLGERLDAVPLVVTDGEIRVDPDA
jgi:nitrite reductase/ring-hydroxylating ferredoxin subunit